MDGGTHLEHEEVPEPVCGRLFGGGEVAQDAVEDVAGGGLSRVHSAAHKHHLQGRKDILHSKSRRDSKNETKNNLQRSRKGIYFNLHSKCVPFLKFCSKYLTCG